MTDTDRLAVQGLTALRGGNPVVDGLTFTVAAGETVGLLGPNGAGKTSAIDAICGFLDKRGGSVRLDALDVTGRQPHELARLGLAQVSQGQDLFPRLSVENNLRLGAVATRGGEANSGDWRDRLLRVFPRLAERLQQPAGSLSGGERQMLAIARALMGRPRVLLLDEPTAGLAPVVVKEIVGLLQQLTGGGLALLLVEQNVDVALALCQRLVVLRRGRVVFEGLTSDLGPDPRRRLGELYV